MKFDVNVEKIYCSHCNKEISRNDKFIFIRYLSFDPYIINIKPKCFCCVKCAKLDEPMLETFINDMVVKKRNMYMYSSDTIFFRDDFEKEDERPRIMALIEVFNEFINKYHSEKVFIELNTTLNKLKMRQEEQMED